MNVTQPRTSGLATVDRLPRDRREALERARALVPALRDRVGLAEEARSVPAATIADIKRAGLLRGFIPSRFGGTALGLASLIEVTTELSRGCVSSGWVYGVLSGHYWLLGQFPIAAQAAVYAEPDPLVAAVFFMQGAAPKKVHGGYDVSGAQGPFCSGIDHSQWVIFGAKPEGEERRLFLIPRDRVEIIDDWFVNGMRGTGSKSIRLVDAVVPEEFTIREADFFAAQTPGAAALDEVLYRLPFRAVWPLSLIGAPLGGTLGALDIFASRASEKYRGASDVELGEQSAMFSRVGEATALVDAAYALILRTAELLDAVPDAEALTERERIQTARDLAFAAQTSRRVVNTLYEESGGSSIFNGSEIQRVWRDVNGVSGHLAFGWDFAMTLFGRFTLGLPAAKTERMRR